MVDIFLIIELIALVLYEIVLVYFAVKYANRVGRSGIGWGVLVFFLTIFAFIILLSLENSLTTRVNIQRGSSVNLDTGKNEPWKCQNCGTTNIGVRCTCCGQSKFFNNGKQSNTNEVKKEEKWVCPKCGKTNNFNATNCINCFNPKPRN